MSTAHISERVRQVEMSGIRKFFQAAKPGSVNLSIGQPDFDTPQHIKDAAIKAINDGMTGYTFNTGVPELRQALSDKFWHENRLSYGPDQILVTAGAGEALYIAMQTLVDNGERVIISDPAFVSYEAGAKLAGGIVEAVPLDESLHIDVDATIEKMDGARLFVLNSPSNPTGAVESEQTIKALAEYASDAGVTILSDEVYEHFIYGKKHISAATFSDDVITINAASKTYAMTGWRLGFLAGNDEYMEHFTKVHQYCQTCATSISQYAAITAYTGDQSCVKEMRDEYRARRDILVNGLFELGFEFPVPEGAFYAFIPMETEMISAIMDHGVIVVPGDAFGEHGKGYIRISYAASRENITTALNRIKQAVEE